jgi:hypothetical protein
VSSSSRTKLLTREPRSLANRSSSDLGYMVLRRLACEGDGVLRSDRRHVIRGSSLGQLGNILEVSLEAARQCDHQQLRVSHRIRLDPVQRSRRNEEGRPFAERDFLVIDDEVPLSF